MVHIPTLSYELTINADDDFGFRIPKNSPMRQSPKVKRLARELTTETETDDEKARAVYDWMRENVDYGWSGMVGGPFFCRNAPHVLRTKQGVCVEQAVLCTALSRAAGLDAQMGVIVDEHGNPGDHGFCAVKKKGKDAEELLIVDTMSEEFGKIYLDTPGTPKVVSDKYVLDKIYKPWFKLFKLAVKNPESLKMLLNYPLYSKPHHSTDTGKYQSSEIKVDVSQFLETGKVDAVYGVYLNEAVDTRMTWKNYKHLRRIKVTQEYDMRSHNAPRLSETGFKASVRYLEGSVWKDAETRVDTYSELKSWIDDNPHVRFETSEKHALYTAIENKTGEVKRVLKFANKYLR